MGYLPYQLAQDIFHQAYIDLYNVSLSFVIPSNISEVFGVIIVLVSKTFLPRFL